MKKARFYQAIIALLTISLLGTSAAAYLMFRTAKSYYRDLNAVRLEPLGLNRFRPRPNVEPLTLLFYGDSRAEQWPEPAWLKGQTMNFGIGGQTTEQILARFDKQLAGRRPKLILLQAGINDLKTIPLFPQSERKIIDTCQANLRQIIDRCHQLGAHVVITTIFPLGKLPLERRVVWSDRVDPAIAEVNEYIASLASENITVFDSSAALTGTNGKLLPECSRDFLHLSAEGYVRLNEALQKLLNASALVRDQ